MKLIRIAPEAAKEITDSELFDRISGDDLAFTDWNPAPSWFYLGVFDPDLIGYFMLHGDNDTTVNIHINMVKEHRKKGKQAAEKFLEEFKDKWPDNFQKLTCKIPVIYPEVYHFTKNVGFEDEGLCKKSIMKNGELVDRHILGLERVNI